MPQDTPLTARPPAAASGVDRVFLIAVPICTLLAVWGILDPEGLVAISRAIISATFRALDWFVLGVLTSLLGIAMWLAVSSYGQLKLGSPSDEPEFSTPSWLAMLFAAGMGVGLMFWGVAEPLLHFTGAPGSIPRSPAVARHAMLQSIFHWGLHGWATFCMTAMVLAYFGLRHGTPYLP